MGITVRVDASRTNRSLADAAQAPSPKKQNADPKLLFWRRLIDQAVADAMRTFNGIPTDSALLARWWLEEHRPSENDKDEYERSFACACGWLNLDAAKHREEKLVEINAAWEEALREYGRGAIYVRRAAVLSCAGVPTRIGKQFVLPLVSAVDYEQVAGIDHPDPSTATARMLVLS